MQRRLSAILAADMVGYSRLMGVDEAGTHTAVKTIRSELMESQIAQHEGRVVKLTGDGILVEFSSVVNAVACAAEIQREMRERNAKVPEDRRIEFRIGVNLGDVIVEGDDIYGDGVNVAARLESIAPVGGIAVSQAVRDQVGNRLDLVFEELGEQPLKNIEKPIFVYGVGGKKATGPTVTKKEKPSIAVLPFTNMSGDPGARIFQRRHRGRYHHRPLQDLRLSVIARHTSFTYKGLALKVQTVGQELGVGFMLEGSVRKAGARVRVSAQLIGSVDGTHLWAERFDCDLTDIFAIQDQITHAIVEQLKVQLLPEEKKSIGQPPTDNIEAYTYYLRGRDFLHRRSKHYSRIARQMFAKAVELELTMVAYAGLADATRSFT